MIVKNGLDFANEFFSLAPRYKTKKQLAKLFGQCVMNPDCCEDCGNPLPEPVLEEREGGYSESVTYCKNCGTTYTS